MMKIPGLLEKIRLLMPFGKQKDQYEEVIEVEELKSDSSCFEYVVYNSALKDLGETELYSIGITIRFNKRETNWPSILRDEVFFRKHLKFKGMFAKRKCKLFFAHRIEKKEYREILFYTCQRGLSCLKLNKLTPDFFNDDDLKITIQRDKKWKLYADMAYI